MRLRLSPPRRRWSFWLLILAWFCANTPQAALPHLLEWIKGAQHFSHEAELRAEVADLLAGQQATPAARLVTAPRVPQPAVPSLPAKIVVKKIDLALARDDLHLRPLQPSAAWPVLLIDSRRPHFADVPHPPPRIVATV